MGRTWDCLEGMGAYGRRAVPSSTWGASGSASGLLERPRFGLGLIEAGSVYVSRSLELRS
jgi:hypothetical protein